MLESQNKINVEFQPSKKMKKRRELDALVCNGKVRRKSKSGHELLRTESESSEIDEFSIAAQKTLFRKLVKTLTLKNISTCTVKIEEGDGYSQFNYKCNEAQFITLCRLETTGTREQHYALYQY